MSQAFSDESWGGPFFELYVEMGPHPESVRDLALALEALWAHEALAGPYSHQAFDPSAERETKFAEYVSEDPQHLYGAVTLPDGKQAPAVLISARSMVISAPSSRRARRGLDRARFAVRRRAGRPFA